MSQSPSRRFYVPALDGLRVLACAMVFFHHGFPSSLANHAWMPREADAWWQALSGFGSYGVSIFFALSAFLITRLLMLEEESTGRIDVKDFYLRRILRIWPVYFLVIVLSVLFSPTFEGFGPTSTGILNFATFTTNFLLAAGGKIPYAIGILWSVCVEEQFYLIWPQVVKRLKGETGILQAAGAMIAIAWVSRIVVVTHGVTWHAIWFNSLCHLDCFGYGVVLAVLHRRQTIRLSTANASLLGVGALGAGWVLTRYLPLVDVPGILPVANGLQYGLVALMGGIVVAAVAFTETSPMAWRPLSSMGKYTYGLYCYHTLALVAARYLVGGTVKEIVAWLSLSVILAVASYHTIETPFLRLKRRFQIVASGAPSADPTPVVAETARQAG